MIEDQISLALKELKKLKQELSDLKKDMKKEEKVDTDAYLELKRTYKDLKGQVKGMEEQWLQDIQKDNQYTELRDMKVKKEEEVATLNKKIFDLIAKLPPKYFLLNMETEEGPVKVQIQPEMRLYLNGKEEKKRA